MSVLITVLTKPGGPVTDLTANDFTVHAGKQQLKVTAAERATQPLSIELLVDNSQPQGMGGAMGDLRTALDHFIQVIRGGDPQAQIGMYNVAGQAIPVVKLDAPAADLDQAISHLFLLNEPTGALLEAIEDASRDLAERPPPRRAIVSVDFASAEATPDTALPGVGKAVGKCGATVWAISVANVTPESRKREAVLDTITHRSGGLRISMVRSSGLPDQLKAIANSLLSQYMIQFPRPSGQLEELKIDTPKGKALATMFAQ
ncbi:MAG: hypothetical protein ACRD1V_00695 [Vicinamibacterales bacterium]